MKGQENPVELLIMSAVMVVLSLLGIIAGFSRSLFGGIDGLLMLAIALMILLIFGLLLAVELKQWHGHKDDGAAK